MFLKTKLLGGKKIIKLLRLKFRVFKIKVCPENDFVKIKKNELSDLNRKKKMESQCSRVK